MFLYDEKVQADYYDLVFDKYDTSLVSPWASFPRELW